MPDASLPPLRVAANAVPLLSPLTGIGQYVRELMTALEASRQVSAQYFYGGGWSANLRSEPLPPAVNQLKIGVRRFLPKSYELNRWLQQKRFSSGLKNWTADVYHEPNFLAFDFDGPTVLTVHDLSWIRYPQAHPIERVRAMHKYFEPSLNKATCIITDAEFVKQELINVFGVNATNISSIHLAADQVFRPQTHTETKPVLQTMGLTHGEYWISVGTLEPRKNLKLLFDAFMQLTSSQRKRCPLVVMGMLGWGYEALLPQLQAMVDAGEVIYTGYLPRAEQSLVLAGAKALIYPSLYEGFGLPLVEAMQCGVPVVAADASCLPEVMGGAGVLVSPHDSKALCQAMQRLLEDSSERGRFSELALQRSRDFSWARCAENTLAVYKQACVARV